MATGSVDGLISGLQTSTIISQLMSLERAPQDRIRIKQGSANALLKVYQTLNTKFAGLATAAAALSRPADWRMMTASSSSTAVTASATSAASSGVLSFKVTQLSQAGAVASTGTVGSTATVVASGPVLVAKGGNVGGFSTLTAGAGLTIGSHTVEVTQATTGASQTGTAALAATTNFAVDATLDVTVNGVAKTYTIAAGSYSASQLASAVAQASGGDLTASVGSDGKLTVVTTHEGGTANLAVTGGSAAASLFLDPMAPATTGTNGMVSVDGGAAVAVTGAGPGENLVLTGANGTINTTLSGGLRLGKTTLANVATGNGSLGAVVDAINASGAGISAAAVKVGDNAYRLQISSTTTGAASDVSVDSQNLVSDVATFATVQSGRDAVIRIGDGAGAYDVSSASDTLTDVLPGVTLQLKQADPDAVVNVTVARDGNGLANKVASLVEAANAAVAFIKQNSAYDAGTKSAGLLISDGTARSLQQQVYSAISGVVPGATLGSASAVGITLAKDGTISFDKAKFTAAYANDPEAVASLFRAGGTASDSNVSFLTASQTTQAGTYAVVVTQAASQAAVTGIALSGAGLVNGETIDVRVGGASGTTVSYTAAAGATLASVANGLNAAFAEGGLAMSAQVVAGQLVLRSSAYGSLTSFEVRSSALGAPGEQTGLVSATGVWESHAGTDVAGTINGVAGTGNGQTLVAPADDPTLGGLALTITATAAGDYGTFTYVPGAAQRLNMVGYEATNFVNGSITNAISGKQSQIRDFDRQIADWDTRLAVREAMLRKQFSSLETMLGKLKDQSNWLAGQLANLPTSSNS